MIRPVIWRALDELRQEGVSAASDTEVLPQTARHYTYHHTASEIVSASCDHLRVKLCARLLPRCLQLALWI